MKKILQIGLIGAYALLAAVVASAAGDRTVVRPRDDGRALVNPGMGFKMHYYDNGAKYGTMLEPGDSLAWFPGCSVVYLRLPWAWLEPEEGRFNWNAIDAPAQQWIARGGQVAFRITVSETMREGATPAWVAKAGAKIIRWNWREGPRPDGKFWECVPDDPVFLEKFGNFLKALAERYDGRKEVAFVDIGSVGIWGEGHTGRTIRLSPEATQRIVKLHIDLHLRHFRKTPLVVNDDFSCSHEGGLGEALEYAQAKGLGWRDDSIMVNDPPWYHEDQAARFWPTAPVILETGHYSIIKDERHLWNGATLLDALERHHASYMSIHGDPRRILDENRETIDRVNRRLGYRFNLRELSWPTEIVAGTNAEPFAVSGRWANVGVAPCLADAFPCLTLKDGQGRIVGVFADEAFNLKELPPGRPGEAPVRTHAATFSFGRWQCPVVRAGEYDVFVSVGERDGTPVYELPYGDGDGARRYRLGRVRLVTRRLNFLD